MTNALSLSAFRGFPDDYQYRPHVCREFIRLLSAPSDTEVLLLEARPGIGATSIAAEYVSTLEEPGILLTLQSGSRAGYSLPFLIDQALQQGHGLLGESFVQPQSDNIINEWHKLLIRLIRKARNQRQRLHLVIDGLYQIPTEDEKYVNDVVKSVLALGNSDVRHVLTWREAAGSPRFLSRCHVRALTVPPLSEAECRSIVGQAGIEADFLKDIIDATHGIPALISSVVRLHHLGKLHPTQLHSDLSAFYELEWSLFTQRHAATLVDLEKLFAFLVFSKRPLTVKELSPLVNANNDFAQTLISDSGFVQIAGDEVIEFNSNTHREFLRAKLQQFRTEVLNKFVDQIALDASSPDSLQLLPNYFEELGRDSDIVSLLTPDNLDRYLAATQSLTSLRRRNELGFRAARRSNAEVEAYRFGLQVSVVRALERHGGNEARLAALATTGRLDQALDAAQSEPTKEAQLLLLSQYAKVLYDLGLYVDAVIASSISNLLEDVDLASDRERAVSIAENLVGPFPDLGVAAIEKSAEGAQDYQDAAFMHLVLKTQARSSGGTKVSAEKYALKVQDSRLQEFLRATEAVFGEKSAEDMRQATIGLDGKHRSFLLIMWIRVHAESPSALEISNYALDEVVRDPTYLPTASDLREICLPVASARDVVTAREVLGRIEAQRRALLEAASTVDTFRLDLELARARTALDLVSHDDALSDLYLRASYVDDDGSKLECFSWMRSSLDRFPRIPSPVFANFKRLSEEELHGAAVRCLSTTAEHLDVIKSLMTALVESNPEAAFQIIDSVNTEDRRDIAYKLFAEKLLSRQIKRGVPLELLLRALGSIVDIQRRCQATVTCLRLTAQRKPTFEGTPQPLIDLASSLEDPAAIATAWRWIIPVADYYGVPLELEDATEKFHHAVDKVDEPWKVQELTYWFIASIAKVNRAFADQQLDAFELRAGPRNFSSEHYAKLTASLARLTSIAFAGTFKSRLDTGEDLNSVLAIIEETPGTLAQVSLYTDLALRAHVKGRKDIFEKVCEVSLMRVIRNLDATSYYQKCSIIRESFVALFLWNQNFADSLLKDLPTTLQDQSRGEVIAFYVTGNTTYEPYNDSLNRGSRLTYPVAVTIVDLIEQMVEDAAIGGSMESFARAVTSKASISEITVQQRAEFANRLHRKVERDLPDKKNIQHPGWSVFCRALCLKIQSDSRVDRWEAIIQEAKAIPNASDSVFVLNAIVGCLPPKMSTQKGALLREAEARLGQIPSLVERVRRRIAFSNQVMTVETEKILAKRLLTTAMRDALCLTDATAAGDAQRRIIDSAYQVDEEFAVELAKMIDEDPARERAKEEVEARLRTQRSKRAVAERRMNELGDEIEDIGEIAWEMLGSLNAGKIAPQRQDETAYLLLAAAKHGLDDVLTFYWWYLRNLQSKYEQGLQQARSVLVPLFEVTRLAALLAERIGRRALRNPVGSNGVDGRESSMGMMVGPGARDVAVDYIKQWLDTCDDGEVLICDPYFRVDDVDFLKTLSFHKTSLSFVILTCAPDGGISGDLDAEYRSAWSKVAHVEPPSLRAVHVTYDGAKSSHPIHDRWILCGSSALRVGTSVSSLGLSKLSEVSRVNHDDVPALTAALSPFLQMRERWIDGKRLRYRVVQW